MAYDVLGNRGEEESQGFFSLVDKTPPQAKVLMPNGGERWRVGERDTIRFKAEDNIGVDSLDIFLSYDGGRSYQDTIAFHITDDSLFAWQITDSLTSDSCQIKVVAYDGGGNVGVDESDSLFSILPPEGVADQGLTPGIPKEFSLSQNYPNPFNPATTIRYQLSAVGRPRSTVTLRIYNLLGELVRTLVDKEQAPGYYSVVWDGKDNLGEEVSSGVYFYRLKAGGFSQVKKMLLMR